jgi:hypothetical protein
MNQAKNDILKAAERALTQQTVKAGRKSDSWDFVNWLPKHVTIKRDGQLKPYSFEGYEPYLAIAQHLHECEENWFLKGTQIGFSTLMLGWNLYLPYWRGLDCGYALPDKVMIKPFMKTRFTKEQLRNNSVLGSAYKEHETELYYDCGSHYIYFLGANVLSETMSRPMEALSLDEVTIISRDAIELIEERLDAASFGQLNGFAREMYPGGPADAGFQGGRQNVYLFKCPHCGFYQNLEEEFFRSSLAHEPVPRCVASINDKWEVVCAACGRPYSREGNGKWVPKHPERDANSYRLPQLIFPGMDLNRVMKRWQKSAKKKSKRSKLHASCLAIPDAGDLQRISKDDLTKLKRDYRMRPASTWTIGGLDMGDTCWAVFAEMEADVLKAIWWQAIDSDHVVEIAAKLIRQMNCQLFVIDGMPLTVEARKIAYLFPDQVRLNYYKGDVLQEKEADHLGNEYRTITQDREQGLDAYCDLFVPEKPGIVFPARVQENGREVDFEESEFAAQHIRGSQKDEVEDRKTGKMIHKFKKGIENHYFHAGNYMATAAALLARDEAVFSGMPPVFGNFMRD